MKYKIAVVGATGVVGRTVLEELKERNLIENDIVLYASKKSQGRKIKIGKRTFVVKMLSCQIVRENFDFALFCTNEKVSQEYVKPLARTGTIVVDFSSLYRKKYPLIVPEINADKIRGKILCNPNCSTIGGVMALYKIKQKFGLRRVIYSTYQAVSGAGKNALDDLKQKNSKKLKSFAYPIRNNLIPYIGNIAKNYYSKEENKMIYETKKILGDKRLEVTATCVRVPIEVCHGESINFETEKKTSTKQLLQTLRETEGVVVKDDYPEYPMPLFVRGQEMVFVGRIRKDPSRKNCFNIFVVSDNLRKGAAQNGVQILQKLIAKREEK